jgi:hypothetical protein
MEVSSEGEGTCGATVGESEERGSATSPDPGREERAPGNDDGGKNGDKGVAAIRGSGPWDTYATSYGKYKRYAQNYTSSTVVLAFLSSYKGLLKREIAAGQHVSYEYPEYKSRPQ